MRPPRTAFVLSGGASLGALQVGMLHALYERGIRADLLVGTSVGALNASFVASRPQTPATAIELATVWQGVERGDVFPMSLRTMVGGVFGHRDHLISTRGLRKIVRRYVEFDELADATTPLHLVAFDVTFGEEVVLSQGSAVEAIAAACSIPGVFPRVPIGDRLLIDAGVVNNTPISHAVELGAELIYVLPTQGPSYTEPPPHLTAFDAAIYGLTVLVGSRLEADIARYRDEVELIVLPAANSQRVQPTDFDHSSELMAEAHAISRRVLARSVSALPTPALAAA
jgi:NTE family protein